MLAGSVLTYKEYKMGFTLPEAKSLIGRSVTVKPERMEEIIFDGLFSFSEQGKIIGISGQDSPQGIPELPWSSNSGLKRKMPFRSWSS